MPNKISVIVPAHNEEKFIGGCLAAIRSAEKQIAIPVEIIVVLNRCTDKTQEAAESFGAICVLDESRCIATIRNKGVAVASGEIIVTCDADSRLPENALKNILFTMSEADTIGGGITIRYDRRSLGIKTTESIFDGVVKLTGLACGAFWTSKESFLAISGFDERLVIGEDIDFAKRLKSYGKTVGKKYRLLKNSQILTSSRKFDHYGDWAFFKNIFYDAFRIRRSLKGIDTEFVDDYFYDFNDKYRKG